MFSWQLLVIFYDDLVIVTLSVKSLRTENRDLSQ